MPRAPRKCPHCRNWQPCDVHPQGWKSNESRPLPSNWNRWKRRMAPYKLLGCRWCLSYKNLELDHIIPRSAGGLDILENLMWLCKTCHAKKTQMDKKKYGRGW